MVHNEQKKSDLSSLCPYLKDFDGHQYNQKKYSKKKNPGAN